VQSGLSSGEGLAEAAKLAGSDPRLLFVEKEFSSVWKHADRRGNSLPMALRKAWDGGSIQIVTKKDPVRVTGAHVSLLGQTTLDDLGRYMDPVEVFSGTANRFLFCCTDRARQLRARLTVGRSHRSIPQKP